jgi:hypothetical protein
MHAEACTPNERVAATSRKIKKMKIIIAPSIPADSSPYLQEILTAFGICFAERGTVADPQRDLLLLPRGAEASSAESFLKAGGNVIAIQPGGSLLRLAGLERSRETDMPTRLRLTQAVCPAVRGESLWTLGPAHWYAPKPGPNVVGYLTDLTQQAVETVAISECEAGTGRLVVFAYDPAECIARLRQGDPKRANTLPPGLRTPRATFLQYPNPPADTFWRPTADLHALVLCGMVERLLARRAPVPRLWHLPDARPAIVLFSGDEDGGTQEANDQQMRDLESVGGAMSLYVVPEGTSITRALIEEYTRRGHTISVHPDLVPTAGQPPAAQLARAEQQARSFHDRFQWPVRTLRNHCYMWPGYLELPELWERLGVGMDGNTTATLYGLSSEHGPYVNIHAAVPLRYVREDGRLIDVFQQPTHINDDLAAHPLKEYSLKYTPGEFDQVAERMLDDAVRFYHSPICANFHPCNYVKFSGEHGRALMRRAHGLSLPIWSLDHWHDFWRARSSWRMSEHAWDETQLRFLLSGPRCDGLSVVLPLQMNGKSLRSVTANGTPLRWETARCHGRPVAQIVLPAGASEVRVGAEYIA